MNFVDDAYFWTVLYSLTFTKIILIPSLINALTLVKSLKEFCKFSILDK